MSIKNGCCIYKEYPSYIIMVIILNGFQDVVTFDDWRKMFVRFTIYNKCVEIECYSLGEAHEEW